MAESGPNISFSQEHLILCPAQEQCIPVPVSHWIRYMTRIKNSGDSSNWYQSLGWASLGFSGSALLAAITFPWSVQFKTKLENGTLEPNLPAIFTEVICTVAAMAGAILGIAALRFAKQHAIDRTELRNVIVEDMTAFAAQCEKVNPPSSHAAA